ncbi:MAG: fibrobacter succinogenes major paralogous domain-containing protein, partial [Patescibacteria group bacterium]
SCSCNNVSLPCCELCGPSSVCQGSTYCGQNSNCPSGQACSGGTCIDFLCGTSQVTVTTLGNYTCGVNDRCVYDTVSINGRCWLKQNMNIGTRVNGAGNQSNNSSLEKYCYSYSLANCTTYGGLYQWDEAMQYSETASAQGICPTGWHIPTDTEQNALDQYLNDTTCNASRSGTWDCSAAGGKLKETGTSHWASPNTGATNAFSFTALPAGYRDTYGSFYDQGSNALFWSSSISGSSAWNRFLYSGYSTVRRLPFDQAYGFSVRCLKD